MLNRFSAFWAGAAETAFALDAHSFSDINTRGDPWALDGSGNTSQHTFSASANLIIARIGYEDNQTIAGVTVDPGGAGIELEELVPSTAGATNLTRAGIWGKWSSTPFALSGAKTISVDLSGNAAGSVGISSYIGATKLPTTKDVDSSGAAGSLTNAIAIGDGEDGGHILSIYSVNVVTAITAGGGLTQQHINAAAIGGQTVAFAHKAGSLSNPEAPSYASDIGSPRSVLASVLVV